MSGLRAVVEVICAGLVLPLRALRGLRIVSFATAVQTLSLIPGFPGIFIRRAWYRATLAECGAELTLAFGATIHDDAAEIGDHCFFGKYSIVGLVSVGDDFMCGDQVQVLSGMQHHDFERRDVPIRSQGKPRRTRVHIGSDVWIGASAVVGCDVAAHCIVGAGAVVAKPVQREWLIVGGVPARQIGERP